MRAYVGAESARRYHLYLVSAKNIIQQITNSHKVIEGLLVLLEVDEYVYIAILMLLLFCVGAEETDFADAILLY